MEASLVERLLEVEERRVQRRGLERVNEELFQEARERVEFYGSRPLDEVAGRLKELEKEWDLERVLMVGAGALSLGSVALGLKVGRGWLVVTGMVGGLLVKHGVTGWCLPSRLLRRWKVRTRQEIDGEKFALKMQRGDFRAMGSAHSAASEGPGWG